MQKYDIFSVFTNKIEFISPLIMGEAEKRLGDKTLSLYLD